MLEAAIIVVIGAMLTVVGWLFGAKRKVSEPDCVTRRKELEDEQAAFCLIDSCPANRQILTQTEHDRICDLKLHPLQAKIDETASGIKELHKKIDKLLLSSHRIEGNGRQ